MIQQLEEVGKSEFAPKAARWDQNREYPHENLERLRTLGILGMTIPARFGGREQPLLDAVLAVETVAPYCGVTARLIVETNMGALGCVLAYGTESQCTTVARRILGEGDKPTIAMTEPSAGTDLSRLTTRAYKQGDDWVINGKKHWITGGGISKTNLIFVRFSEGEQELGIGAILVDKDTPGFSCGKVEKTMGLRGIPETELLFHQCVVPNENVVVAGDGTHGLKKLMTTYNAQRVGASAVAIGIARGAHELALRHMHERSAFGQPLSEFQGLQWEIARAELKLTAGYLLIAQAASNALHLPNNVMAPLKHEASMAKAFVGDAAIEVVSNSLQIFGAAGYSEDCPLERMYRDVRMFKIGGGTTEAQWNILARHILDRELH